MSKSCTLDRLVVRADDENGVSDAGLLVAATLGQRLGLGELLREHVTVPGSAGANPDRKCLTVIHSLLAGGDCVEDVNALRAGSTGAVLGHRVAGPRRSAPSYVPSGSTTPASSTRSHDGCWPERSRPAPMAAWRSR